MKARIVTLVAAVGSAVSVLAHPGHDDVFAPVHPVLADGLPASQVKIEVRDGFRHITSNGIPDHAPGAFPNRGNPHAMAPQNYAFKVPAEPKVAYQPTPARGQPFGVAVNGVVFDPGTAELWRNDRRWNTEAFGAPMNLGLDKHNAHVQPSGAYHYHALPVGLFERLRKEETSKPMTLVGWAADGFPIYGFFAHAKADDAKSPRKEMKSSWQLRKADRPGGDDGPGGKPDGTYTADWEYVAGSGDLDECNGRVGVTPEFPTGTYYYVITDQFPFIPRMYRGMPDESFQRRGPGRDQRPGPRASAE